MYFFKRTFIDKKLVLFISTIYLVAYTIDFFSTLILQNYNNENNFTTLNLLLKYLLTYPLKLLYLFFAIHITTNIVKQKKVALKSIITHCFLAFTMSFYAIGINLLFSKYIFREINSISFETIWVKGIYSLSFSFFIYTAIIAIVYAYYYLQKEKEVVIKQERLKRQLLDSKINMLQSQLQPHFLFNAMNGISSLMDIDIEKSQNAIADLSSLLRNTLQIKETKYISLKKELAILQHYLNIEKIRFGNKLNFILKYNTDLNTLKVPPLILQPFIENAIKHGFSYNHQILNIKLLIYLREKHLIFEIINDGALLKKNFTFGNGISNVLQRLDTLYNIHYRFKIKNIEPPIDQVNVTIAIPKLNYLKAKQ